MAMLCSMRAKIYSQSTFISSMQHFHQVKKKITLADPSTSCMTSIWRWLSWACQRKSSRQSGKKKVHWLMRCWECHLSTFDATSAKRHQAFLFIINSKLEISPFQYAIWLKHILGSQRTTPAHKQLISICDVFGHSAAPCARLSFQTRSNDILMIARETRVAFLSQHLNERASFQGSAVYGQSEKLLWYSKTARLWQAKCFSLLLQARQNHKS